MLRISIGRSVRLSWLLCIAHAGALAILIPLAMPVWMKVSIAIAIATSLLYSLLHTALLKTAGAIVAVEIREPPLCSFQMRRGDWRDCRLSGSSYVSPWLTVLVLREENRWPARYVVIMPDNVDADEFRRLRVLLRWGDWLRG